MIPLLRGDEITVHYGSKTAVHQVSFSLAEGDWLMLVGPNGAGKSTLLKAISQSIPWEGRITLCGKDIKALRPAALAREIAVLSQLHPVEYSFTVEEIVSLGRYAHERGLLHHRDSSGLQLMENALAMTGLTELRHTSVLSLSGGELQRVFLAQVFAQNPRILLLDEPANHLDLQYQQHVFTLIADWLRAGDRAVISVVHDLSLARRFGTHALLLHEGYMAACGAMKETLTPQVLQSVYHMDVYAWMQDLLEPWQHS